MIGEQIIEQKTRMFLKHDAWLGEVTSWFKLSNLLSVVYFQNIMTSVAGFLAKGRQEIMKKTIQWLVTVEGQVKMDISKGAMNRSLVQCEFGVESLKRDKSHNHTKDHSCTPTQNTVNTNARYISTKQWRRTRSSMDSSKNIVQGTAGLDTFNSKTCVSFETSSSLLAS